jgi:hypothetical protein
MAPTTICNLVCRRQSVPLATASCAVSISTAALTADDDGAEATFTTTIPADAHPGYPFAIALAIRYRLDTRGLGLEVTIRNVGDRAAPCFFGWHPYFRLGDTPMASWQLQVPARTVRTDADYIPLAGAAAHVPIEREPSARFPRAAHGGRAGAQPPSPTLARRRRPAAQPPA